MAEASVTLTPSHFDEAARRWDENPLFQERANTIAAAIRAGVPLNRSMRALDYGSGTGLLSFPLRHELGHITLKDTSSGMLDVLREKIAAQGVSNMTVRQVDLTTEPLGHDRNDNPVYLRELWPTRAEIDAAVRASLTPEMFRSDYADVFSRNETWNAVAASASINRFMFGLLVD